MSIECKIGDRPAAADRDVRNILCSSKTVAVVGISAKERVPQPQGFKISDRARF